MLVGQLTVEIVRDGEAFEDALDRVAIPMVLDSRAETLLPVLHHLMGLDLTDRPFAQTLVALVANADTPKRAELTFGLLDAATATLSSRNDAAGEAIVAWVRGNVLLGLGEVGSAARSWRHAAEIDPSTSLVEDLSLANLAYASYGVTGSLDEALPLAITAAASARARGHSRAEGLALAYQAFFQIMAGDFAEAEAALGAADTAFGRAARHDEPPYEWPLVHAGAGALASTRGNDVEADTCFLRAILLARQMDNPWYEAIVRTLRADRTMNMDTHRALSDCRWALHVFEDVSDRWWAAIAMRVRADATLIAGEVEASRQLALKALAELESPVERGRCLVTLSRALVASGDREAAAARAREAVQALEPTGANFLLCEALIVSAGCDPAGAADAIEWARHLSTADPGYARLWEAHPNLHVEVLGRGSVSVGSERVRFRTSRAENLVLMLALADGRVVDVERICSSLWPSTAGSKAASNLSTAAHDARRALRSEAWRLHRSGSHMWLDVGGAAIDVADAMRLADGPGGSHDPERVAALESLRREILPTVSGEEWVTDANRTREAFLQSVLPTRSETSDD